MESAAQPCLSEQETAGITYQRRGVGADGKVRGGNMQIVPQGKRGQFFRYIFVKQPPEGLILQPRARALLAIIEAGMDKGGFTRRELKTVVAALIPAQSRLSEVIKFAQAPLLKHGLIRIEEGEVQEDQKKICLTDPAFIVKATDNG